MLGAISQALQAYTERVKGCFVGRLNGSDFAMCLPVGGVSEETARSTEGLRAVAPPAFGKSAAVAAGAVELAHGVPMAQLMSEADMALARAEAQGAFAVETSGEVVRHSSSSVRAAGGAGCTKHWPTAASRWWRSRCAMPAAG